MGETETVFTALCPFHGNTDTYAFAVNKTNGKYICFNPACGRAGELLDLVRYITKLDVFPAYRFILKRKAGVQKSFEERFAEATKPVVKFTRWPQEPIDRMKKDFWNTPHAIEYMHSRGFHDDTLDYFDVGYSNAPDKTGKPRNMIVVPMHDPTGMPVGLIGRTASHEEKVFKNSKHLPRKETLFNLHRARAHQTAIVVEASFCTMRVHQAGHPNVVGLLGGSLSPWHIEQFNKYFSTIIIMTDDDFYQKDYCPECRPRPCQGHFPGRKLGRAIADSLPHKTIRWALYSEESIYENGAKDPTAMSDDGIRQSLKNAVGTFKYNQLTLATV